MDPFVALLLPVVTLGSFFGFRLWNDVVRRGWRIADADAAFAECARLRDSLAARLSELEAMRMAVGHLEQQVASIKTQLAVSPRR